MENVGTSRYIYPVKRFTTNSDQVHRLELYALLHISEAEAVEALTHDFDVFVKLFGSTLDHIDPQAARSVVKCYSLARDIYLRRATSSGNFRASSDRELNELADAVKFFKPGGTGEHLLGWVYFIGAAESTSEKHRRFFKARFEDLFPRAGYGYVPKGAQLLEALWQQSRKKNWTTVLAQRRDSAVLIG